jgi:hypothetical protein
MNACLDYIAACHPQVDVSFDSNCQEKELLIMSLKARTRIVMERAAMFQVKDKGKGKGAIETIREISGTSKEQACDLESKDSKL